MGIKNRKEQKMAAEIYKIIEAMTEEEAKAYIEEYFPMEMNLVENSIKRGGTYKGNLEFLVSFA